VAVTMSTHHILGDTANFMYGYVVTSSVAKVVGANARAIRQDANVTLDRLTAAMKRCGLRWSTGRIGSFESGHVPARLETLYTVALALGQATGRPVRLEDLFVGDGDVALNDELSVPLSALRAAVSRKPVAVGETEMTRKALGPDAREWAEVAVRTEFREADFRVCRKLGVTPEQGALAMGDLWSHTFSTERDLQTEPGANAQRRGQISRELQKLLAEELARGDDQ
jgi:hypothetical protein